MQVALMDKARIEREWPFIAEFLWPAVRQDPTYDLMGLYRRLLDGSALLFQVTNGALGFWVISLGEDDGDLVAWTTAIAGKIDGGPKARVAAMRQAVRALEETLKSAGVKAHRICGRDWSRLLPDYVSIAGFRNGLEKRL